MRHRKTSWICFLPRRVKCSERLSRSSKHGWNQKSLMLTEWIIDNYNCFCLIEEVYCPCRIFYFIFSFLKYIIAVMDIKEWCHDNWFHRTSISYLASFNPENCYEYVEQEDFSVDLMIIGKYALRVWFVYRDCTHRR